ncbi:MAG: diphthine--ammonia ligase [Candidatus Bathyarchaeia archaeon]
MANPKVIAAWSGGKDSALALYEALKSGMEVLELLTTVTKDSDRISIHGVRRVLLEQQVEAVGLPLEKMLIPKGASDREYEETLLTLLKRHRKNGVTAVVFGDIFLADIKTYREKTLTEVGMRGIYPLWGRDTRSLADEFIDLGFKAAVTVVDSRVLGREFAGRLYDEQFLADLPAGVDPCGENGEFHTFVYDGPLLSKPVAFTLGEVTLLDGRFWLCDLLPKA